MQEPLLNIKSYTRTITNMINKIILLLLTDYNYGVGVGFGDRVVIFASYIMERVFLHNASNARRGTDWPLDLYVYV